MITMLNVKLISLQNRILEVSFSSNSGAFIGILGANGSGKTTLLRLLSAELQPDQGTIYYDENTTSGSIRERRFIRSQIAIVHADPDAQLVAATVAEEIAFGLRANGTSLAVLQTRVEQALERFNLQEVRDVHPFYLSLGEKHRLNFAARWVLNPAWWFLDEMTSMMDSPTRSELLQEVKGCWREQRCTIVMATHRIEDLRDAQRILVLHEGRLVADAPFATVIAQISTTPEWKIQIPPIVALHMKSQA